MTYRTGNHWGVTIVREFDHIDVPGGQPRAELIAVVVNGDQALAERICALLNADQLDPEPCTEETLSWDHFQPQQIDRYWISCGLAGPHDVHKDGHTGLSWRDVKAPAADSCTCTIVGPHPDCPVHHGRRARGPKPPPVGPFTASFPGEPACCEQGIDVGDRIRSDGEGGWIHEDCEEGR